MGLPNEEQKKLDLFKNFKLDRNQTETIIGRKLNNTEWKQLKPKDYKKIFSPIARQVAKAANKRKPSMDLRQMFRKVAMQAAKKANRNQKKKAEEPEDNFHFIKSLYKNTNDDYEINKVSEYYSNKYKTTVSDWKLSGSVNLFNINNVMKDLIQKMTEHLHPNSKIQVSLKISNSTRQPHTSLLSKDQITDLLSEWVNYFIDYYDINIEDITFKLTAIELPQGAGRKVNAIINLDDKRSITQIKNKDTICLVRAIIVGLSYNKNKLQETFKGKLSDNEIKEINYRRQVKTEINDGIISDNEIKYIRQGVKIQDVLAVAFHRIYSILIKATGNDFADVQLIEKRLDIEIQIYNMKSKQIYAGVAKTDKIYLLIDNNHYDVISKLPAFIGSNARTWEANEKLKCEACKNPTKCNKENKIKCQTCGKVFYSQNCFDSHIKNKKCIEHSYVCQTCFRFFKVIVRKVEDHKCGEKYCSNCKDWRIGEHKCYMQKKDIKEPSEKYIFYDFETKLNEKGKHVVNYCIAQYFYGKEYVFNTADVYRNG